MNKQQTPVTALVLPAAGDPSPDTGSLVKRYLYHWPLFLLGVLLALAAAYYYLRVTSPQYPVMATLKFKTPTSTSAGGPRTDNSMAELNPVNNLVIVENELKMIQSKKLIFQVVKDLQLWVNYTQKKGSKRYDLYNKGPVLFNFIDTNVNLGPTGAKLDIVIRDDNSFVIKDSGGAQKVFQYNTPLKSGFGRWQLKPTAYIRNYAGAKISLTIMDADMVADSYQKSIKVELENKNAPFVNLSMTDEVPSRGKDILNSLINMYRANAQQEKYGQTQKILEFITARVDSLGRELENEEKNLKNYRQAEGITDITAQAEGYRSIKDINSQQVNAINVQLSTLESLEKYAGSSSNSQKLPAATENLPDRSLADIYNKLAELQLEREKKLAITPEANPIFISIDRQINALKSDFKEKIQIIRASLLANKKQLQSYGSGVQASLNKVPYQEKEYNELKRRQEGKENMYKLLSAKREELALHYASLIEDSEVVDDAHAGTKKWPKGSIVYAMALILGMAAPAGLIYARESFNERITSRRQIEKGTDVPVLGELSYQRKAGPIVVTSGRSKFAIGEQFRALRTNLYHLYGNNESGRVTLVTSGISGEGKSFVSANLAVTLAYASRKTVILEMDLRKPRLSGMFGLAAEGSGLSDYLDGTSSNLQEMIRSTNVPGLDMISSGTVLTNPSELLGKARLDEFISELKKRYDDIIIDSPPIHLVTDAFLMARISNVTIYIVKYGYTHKNEFDFINEISNSNRFKKFTVVFNGIKRDASAYENYDLYADNKKKVNFEGAIKSFFNRF